MEALCLALALYFESRGEPLQGQIAVGQVILSRVESPRFPDTICEVVMQPYQFEFLDNWKYQAPLDQHAWEHSQYVAMALTSEDSGIYPYHQGALHFAEVGVWRHWMEGATVHRIGNHIFYIGVE